MNILSQDFGGTGFNFRLVNTTRTQKPAWTNFAQGSGDRVRNETISSQGFVCDLESVLHVDFRGTAGPTASWICVS